MMIPFCDRPILSSERRHSFEIGRSSDLPILPGLPIGSTDSGVVREKHTPGSQQRGLSRNYTGFPFNGQDAILDQPFSLRI